MLLKYRPYREQAAGDVVWIALEVTQVVYDAGVVLDGCRLPSADRGEIYVVADSDVFQVLLPALIALVAKRLVELV